MNLDWINTIIPIINATGIPILTIGIILLLRAYQKSVETYKDTTLHLQNENGRLREQLKTLDSSYVDSLNKMRETVSKSTQAIGELQAAKISLLTNSNNSPAEVIQSDVEKIDVVLAALTGLEEMARRGEHFHKEMEYRINAEIDELEMRINRRFNEIGELITQIGDTNTRLSIVRVIATNEVFQSLKSQVGQRERGLNFLPENKNLKLPESAVKSDNTVPPKEEDVEKE